MDIKNNDNDIVISFGMYTQISSELRYFGESKNIRGKHIKYENSEVQENIKFKKCNYCNNLISYNKEECPTCGSRRFNIC